MRAVGYYRQIKPELHSPKNTRESYVGSPRVDIERFCLEESHNLIHLIGSEHRETSETEHFGRLMEQLRGPNSLPSLVVIPDTRHIATNLEMLVHRLLAINDAKADVRCTELGLPDPFQNGLKHLSLSGRKIKSEQRIRNAILAKAARGEVLGRTPFGYDNAMDGTLKPVPHEAVLVRYVFDLYTGFYDGRGEPEDSNKGLGLRRISARLLDKGLLTRHGNPWSPVALSGMIQNRVYIGTYARYGMRLPGNHQPLVDRKVFNLAQKLLDSRTPRRMARVKRIFPLGRIANCALCNHRLRGITRKRHWQQRDGRFMERSYRYYECPVRDIDKHPVWRAEKLEKSVINKLGKLVGDNPDAILTDPYSSKRMDSRNIYLLRAEREFMRAYRQAAFGRKNLRSLVQNLGDLSSARDTSVQSDKTMTSTEALTNASTLDFEISAQSFRFLLKRVVVFDTEIELLTRF